MTRPDRSIQIDRLFVTTVKENHPEPLTTDEVATKLGYSDRGAYKRLKSLEESDRIEMKKAGSGAVWYVKND